MDSIMTMLSEIKNEIRAKTDDSISEPTIKGRVKTYTWAPIEFIAEDGGICHKLLNARLTLIHDDSTNPPTCFANFTADRAEGGRRGRFDCVIYLKGDNNADIMQLRFGNIEMPCHDSSKIILNPVRVQPGLFDLVNGSVFPATKETGVEAC